MAYEENEYKLGDNLQGAQNWWAHFADTGQLQDYPLSIAGVPASGAEGPQVCDQRDKFGTSCNCVDASLRHDPQADAAAPSSEVGLMVQKLLRGQRVTPEAPTTPR